MIRTCSLAAVLGVLIFVVGCGGNNSSMDSNGIIPQSNNANAVSNGPSSGDLSVYVTDNLSDKYDHVWVSIKKIDLNLAAGGTHTIFDDAQGVGVDLSSLRDESGPKFRYLNDLVFPAGTYVGATITLNKSAVLFPTNTTTGQEVPFDAASTNATEATLTVKFDPPKLLGTGHDDLVLDFDLSQWKSENGKLTAVVVPSLGAGLEQADRSTAVIERGIVSDVKGDVPTQSFTVKDGKMKGVSVATSMTTALIGLNGSSDPTVLTKDQSVEVAGTFDTNTRRFSATSIRVLDPKAPEVSEVLGVVSAIDQKAGTWQVTPSQTRSLLPQATTIPMTLSDHASFFGASGLALTKDDFFKGLSASKSVNVLVSGTFDEKKNSFLAGEVRFQDMDAQPEVKVAGLVGDPKTDDQTFGLTVTTYEGLLSKPGAATRVAITPATTFVDAGGKPLTSDAFFGALAAPKVADIDGVIDTSTGNVLATTVKISDAPASLLPKATKKTIVAASKTTTIAPKK